MARPTPDAVLVSDAPPAKKNRVVYYRDPPIEELVPRERACSDVRCDRPRVLTAAFCFRHILQDPDQKLYVPCAFVRHTGSACTTPVLRVEGDPGAVCLVHARLTAERRFNPNGDSLIVVRRMGAGRSVVATPSDDEDPEPDEPDSTGQGIPGGGVDGSAGVDGSGGPADPASAPSSVGSEHKAIPSSALAGDAAGEAVVAMDAAPT